MPSFFCLFNSFRPHPRFCLRFRSPSQPTVTSVPSVTNSIFLYFLLGHAADSIRLFDLFCHSLSPQCCYAGLKRKKRFSSETDLRKNPVSDLGPFSPLPLLGWPRYSGRIDLCRGSEDASRGAEAAGPPPRFATLPPECEPSSWAVLQCDVMVMFWEGFLWS